MKKCIITLIIAVLVKSLFAQTVTYSYDKLGRLTRAAYPDSSIITYTYDPSGNRTAIKIQDDNYHKTQTVTFNPIQDVVYGTPDFDPGAISTNDSIPISYRSRNKLVATITGSGKIHIVGVGKVTIAAFQAGDKTYLPSDTVLQAFTVTPAPLTITADDQSRDYRAADPPFTVTYTGFVNGDDASKLNPGPVVNTAATVASPIGKYPLQPSAALDPNYTITYQPGTLTIKPASRTLTFGSISAKIYTDPDFDPGATLSSGDPVVYSSANTAVATIVQGKIHITGTGNSDITAAAPVDSNYLAVPSVTQTLTVNKAPQTITFHIIPVQQKSAGVYITGATASSGLPVTLSSSDISIAAIDGLSVKLLELGTAEITATQAGNNNYLPATAVARTLKIEGAGGSLVLVHRIVSPNGDGINDALLIEGIKDYPDNTLTIVNRNGVKVFQISNYDNSSHVFTGHGINGELLPQGTYFFQLDYQVKGEVKQMTDYFVIKL